MWTANIKHFTLKVAGTAVGEAIDRRSELDDFFSSLLPANFN